jgi:hypothetical protein
MVLGEVTLDPLLNPLQRQHRLPPIIRTSLPEAASILMHVVFLAEGDQLQDEVDDNGDGADTDLNRGNSTVMSHCWMVRP